MVAHRDHSDTSMNFMETEDSEFGLQIDEDEEKELDDDLFDDEDDEGVDEDLEEEEEEDEF
ncbi:MAG: hypothetical protein WCT49_00065 [Candidatus Paceibacterota bacterium]|jgi:hypothetical protein|nr:hypothetical protein [Candidatus Paceibacterota bacterium]